MIDTHCHILPGIDDGARNLEEALDMARIAVKDGIKTIIATPHVAEHGIAGARQRIAQQAAAFQDMLVKAGIPLTIVPGAEVRVTPDLPQYVSSGDLPTVGNGSALLVELPFDELPVYLGQLIFELRLAGVTPIIAHPERNRILAQEPNRILSYLEQGALAQVNAGSLMGHFGESAKKAALIMATHNMVHMIGSDAHRSGRHRRPVLSVCRQSLAGVINNDCISDLFCETAHDIMEGNTLRRREPFAYKPRKEGLLQLVWGFMRNS